MYKVNTVEDKKNSNYENFKYADLPLIVYLHGSDEQGTDLDKLLNVLSAPVKYLNNTEVGLFEGVMSQSK